MQAEINYLTEENTNLTIEINEGKRKIQNIMEKSSFVEQKLEDTVIEAAMHREKVASMLEENRKLVTETAVLNKNIENQKSMLSVLEK